MAGKRPRFHMYFTPTSASWLNRVERFFRDVSENRLRRGVFPGVPELVSAIDEYIAHHNTNLNPFVWIKSARGILHKVIHANNHLSSKKNDSLPQPTKNFKKIHDRCDDRGGLRLPIVFRQALSLEKRRDA
jgi:hypothetical protein